MIPNTALSVCVTMKMEKKFLLWTASTHSILSALKIGSRTRIGVLFVSIKLEEMTRIKAKIKVISNEYYLIQILMNGNYSS